MKLVRLAKERWEILAACDNRGRCEVLEFLSDLEGDYQAAALSMVVFLTQFVARKGPPKAEPWCKPLGGGLFEFRKQPKGKKLRVIWYYGGGNIVVCSAAFTKAERTPRSELDRSRLHLERYRLARARGAVEIVDITSKDTRRWGS